MNRTDPDVGRRREDHGPRADARDAADALWALADDALAGLTPTALLRRAACLLRPFTRGIPFAATVDGRAPTVLHDDATLAASVDVRALVALALERRATAVVDPGATYPPPSWTGGVAVPVDALGSIAGVLGVVQGPEGGELPIDLVQDMARVIGRAAARVMTEDVARRRSHEVAALFAVGHELERNGDVAGLAERVSQHLAASIAGRVRVAIIADGRRREAGDRLTYSGRHEVPIRCVHGPDGAIVVEHQAGAPLSLTEQAAVASLAGLFGAWLDRRRAAEGLERSEERFRRMATVNPHMIYVLELRPTLRFTYVSPASTAITGYEPDAFLRDPALLQRGLDEEGLRAMQDVHGLSDGEVSAYTARWQHPDGGERWLRDVRVPVIEDGQVTALQGVMSDVTSVQVERARLEAALEREQRAAEELRSVHAMKDGFLRSVSHELRTPLTCILGYAVTLQQHPDDIAPAHRDQILQGLVANSHRLGKLVTDLLDMDRLSRGTALLHLKTTDVGAVVAGAMEELAASGRIRVDIRSAVIGVDVAKLSRMVEHLVVNALKHAPADSPVWVRVGPSDTGAFIAVEDAGYGVTPALRNEIFEPFAQGPRSATDPQPGTGVGLALVRRLAELHGGTVTVSDRVGGGARFCVELPTVPSAGTPAVMLRDVDDGSPLTWPGKVLDV